MTIKFLKEYYPLRSYSQKYVLIMTFFLLKKKCCTFEAFFLRNSIKIEFLYYEKIEIFKRITK